MGCEFSVSPGFGIKRPMMEQAKLDCSKILRAIRGICEWCLMMAR
jgi:hypothetical protein